MEEWDCVKGWMNKQNCIKGQMNEWNCVKGWMNDRNCVKGQINEWELCMETKGVWGQHPQQADGQC